MENTPQTVRERPGTAQERKLLMEQIAAYVDANLTGKITLKQVAAHFRISVSTVTQLFQKKTQNTFHHFLTNRRMEKARNLIREGLPLAMVGRAIGYRDHSTFYRAFRQTFGISPREYRKKLHPEVVE